MIEIISTVTRKGQITVPAALRRAWGLKEGDQVAFLLDDDQVRLAPRGGAVATTAGVFKRYSRQLATDDERRTAVERAIAEEVAASLER